jgi:uncharacterized protein (TIGR02996 family)
MNTLEGLLAGIVAEPEEETRWLVLADWLEENDDPRRGELLRLHRNLLATCCEPEKHRERAKWQARIVELIGEGVHPCVPQKTVLLPGAVEMKFSFIPPGTFRMGSRNGKSDEKPVHTVKLTKGFYLGIYLVTQVQWKAVMGSEPSCSKGADRPVDRISWNDALEFCMNLTRTHSGLGQVRLPKEAEWEYACRAGTTTDYHTGNGKSALVATGWNAWNSGSVDTHRVGQLAANPWNLYDMHGNVGEWCNDWYANYSPEHQTDPAGPTSGLYRVSRGGFYTTAAVNCRSAARFWQVPSLFSFHEGFRCAINS